MRNVITADGVESPDATYFSIASSVVSVYDICGVGQRIVSMRHLPQVFEYSLDLCFVHLDVMVFEQGNQVCHAERNAVGMVGIHDFVEQFCHVQFQAATTGIHDSFECCRAKVACGEPHAALYPGVHLAMQQKIQEGRNLDLQLFEKVGIIGFKMPNLANPEASFFRVGDNRECLVVGTKDELGEEFNLMSILLLGFDLVVECRAEILQTFGVLTFIQHHLIHDNKKLGSPVLVELAAEIFVGVERDIILKDGFQEIEECGFTRLRSSETSRRIGSFWSGRV